jgi:putative ABC transport system permease protein
MIGGLFVSMGYVGLGVKFAVRRRRIAIFTILSIAISVSLLLSAFSVGSSLRMNAGEYIRATSSPVDITIASTKWDEPIDSEMMAAISLTPNVADIIPRIEETARVQNGSDWLNFLLIGLDPSKEKHIGSFSVTGGVFDINESSCFLSDSAFHLANLSIGDHIELHTSSGVHFFEVKGYGSALDKGVVGPAVIIHISSAWDLFSIRYPNNSTNKLLVEVHDVFRIPATVYRLRSVYGVDYVFSNQKTYSLWTASTFLSQVNFILGTLTVAVFFVAALRVFSSYSLIFTERRFETGLMFAYGASRFQVLIVLIAEIIFVGLIGAITGIILSLLTGSLLSSAASSILTIISPINADALFRPGFSMNPVLVIVSITLGIIVTVIAGLIPAFIATRQPVIESLKHIHSGVSAPASIPSMIRRTIWVSIRIAGISLSTMVIVQLFSDVFSLNLIRSDLLRFLAIPSYLLLVGGLSAYLATPSMLVYSLQKRTRPVVRKLLSTSLRRKSIGAFLIFNLFVSVSMIFMLSSNVSYTLLHSWDNTIGWQSSSANVVAYLDETVGFEELEQVRDQQNISEMSEMSNTYQFLKHMDLINTGIIFGIQPETFQNLAAVGIQESLDFSAGLSILNNADSCIISDFAAQVLDIQVGEQLEIADLINLTVVATCDSSIPVFLFTIIEPLFLLVDTNTLQLITQKPFEPSGVLIDSLDPESTVAALSKISGVYPVLVSTVVYNYATALNSLSVTVNLTLGLLLFTVVVGAVLSGWSAATTRRREIGMLRAQGMEGNEVAQILSLENAVPMLSGLIWGLVVGFAANLSLANIIRRFSGGVFSFVDYTSISLIVLVFLISVLVSYFASLQVTKSSVSDLLTDRQKSS